MVGDLLLVISKYISLKFPVVKRISKSARTTEDADAAGKSTDVADRGG